MGTLVSCSTTSKPKSNNNSYTSNSSQLNSQTNNETGIIDNNKDNYFNDEEQKYYDKINGPLIDHVPNKINWIPLNQHLGQGSYGQVILGQDQNTGQFLAVKQLSIKGYNITNSDMRINSFKMEIELLSKLDHFNIVKYFGMEKTESHINLFLEYVAGGSIQSMLNKYGQFKQPLLKGLEYLHSHGIIHRDIKGANVLVDNNGVCKLADFGSSKKLTEMLQNEECKTLIGTPNWMAPEVIKQVGHGRYADIWSLGCTVIEMASGRPPWTENGMQKNQMAILLEIANGNRPPPYPKEMSQQGIDFLNKCFNMDPSKRWNVKQLLAHPFVNDGVNKNLTISDVSALFNHLIQQHKNNDSKLDYKSNQNSTS